MYIVIEFFVLLLLLFIICSPYKHSHTNGALSSKNKWCLHHLSHIHICAASVFRMCVCKWKTLKWIHIHIWNSVTNRQKKEKFFIICIVIALYTFLDNFFVRLCRVIFVRSQRHVKYPAVKKSHRKITIKKITEKEIDFICPSMSNTPAQSKKNKLDTAQTKHQLYTIVHL